MSIGFHWQRHKSEVATVGSGRSRRCDREAGSADRAALASERDYHYVAAQVAPEVDCTTWGPDSVELLLVVRGPLLHPS